MKLNLLTCLLTLSIYSGYVLSEGDSAKGEAKAIICSACHGNDGISINQEWPNLASQHAKYIIKELTDFKNGKTRQEPTMTAMVANLSDTDIDDLAVFYASKGLKISEKVKEKTAGGEEIYRRGDLQKHITACIACHGPDGKGNGPAGFPLLSGQNPKYTIKQLNLFKDKSRTNDINIFIYRSYCLLTIFRKSISTIVH